MKMNYKNLLLTLNLMPALEAVEAVEEVKLQEAGNAGLRSSVCPAASRVNEHWPGPAI